MPNIINQPQQSELETKSLRAPTSLPQNTALVSSTQGGHFLCLSSCVPSPRLDLICSSVAAWRRDICAVHVIIGKMDVLSLILPGNSEAWVTLIGVRVVNTKHDPLRLQRESPSSSIANVGFESASGFLNNIEDPNL